MALKRRVLMEENDMDGRQHSAMEVQPLPFHTLINLQQLWCCKLIHCLHISRHHISTVAEGLRCGLSRNSLKSTVLMDENDMDGSYHSAIRLFPP